MSDETALETNLDIAVTVIGELTGASETNGELIIERHAPAMVGHTVRLRRSGCLPIVFHVWAEQIDICPNEFGDIENVFAEGSLDLRTSFTRSLASWVTMPSRIEGGKFGFQHLVVERRGSDPLVVKIWNRKKRRVPPNEFGTFRPYRPAPD